MPRYLVCEVNYVSDKKRRTVFDSEKELAAFIKCFLIANQCEAADLDRSIQELIDVALEIDTEWNILYVSTVH